MHTYYCMVCMVKVGENEFLVLLVLIGGIVWSKVNGGGFS